MMTARYLVIVMLVALAGGASAQPGGPGGASRETKVERVKKRVRALRAYTLTEELGLDPAAAARLFPVLARYDEAFDRLLAARGALTKALDAADGVTDPKALDKQIDQLLANQRALWDLEDQRIAELRKLLAPAQIARVLIVLPALERRIQNQLRKAAHGAGPDARRAAPARDTRDADDDVEPNEPPPRRAHPAANPPAPTPTPPPRRQGNCDPFSTLHGC
jgi:hypothetical protein